MSAHIDVRRVANLARLNLTEEEASSFTSQIERVLGYVELLQQVNTEGVEVTAHPLEAMDCLRADAERPGFGVENALRNAPRSAQDQIYVPKVVE